MRHWVYLCGLIVSLSLVACSGVPTGTLTSGEISPFVAFVRLSRSEFPNLTGVHYTIAPKPSSVSKPVHVEYSISALQTRGFVEGGAVTVPIYGLYAGYENQVSLEVETDDGVTTPLQFTIPTEEYRDPTGIYSRPTVVMPRAQGSNLGFDFIFMKSALGSPVIVDTDGEIRWAAPGVRNSMSSTYANGSFIIGNTSAPNVDRLALDGSITRSSLSAGGTYNYSDFNHDINWGNAGFLAEVDEMSGGVKDVESNVIEFQDPSSATVLNHWDLGAILSAYMSSHGDDAAAFVRPGIDWFHSNSAIYDPSDNSLIVSSRENFVIKLDYKTGAIIWIFGDPTKYWYTFPSLRAKALTLMPTGGLYPVGQHGLSITSDGLLMLFNDGLGSVNEPSGTSPGVTRTFSAVSAYAINEQAMTANNVWNYEAGQSIFTAYCSSAYQAPHASLLIDYATADNGTEALLVGLDSNHTVAFEIEYANNGCNTSWNAVPFPFDDLEIDH